MIVAGRAKNATGNEGLLVRRDVVLVHLSDTAGRRVVEALDADGIGLRHLEGVRCGRW
jgi:hypothetical protein